jgi:purine nucleoside phosphorylase
MKLTGIISSTVLQDSKSFKNMEKRTMENEFGKASVFISDTVAYIPRHGEDRQHYILPHLVNHQANLKALKDIGVEEIISTNSTGSLKRHLKPGMFVVPDDFIVLYGGPTIFDTTRSHITPILNEEIRKKWIEAAYGCGIDAINGGVYWQTTGPRLETRAEIKMMSTFADLVGMTMGSEAIIARELDLSYASICSVDNYGHGLIGKPLTVEEISEGARRNTEVLIKIANKYLERNLR